MLAKLETENKDNSVNMRTLNLGDSGYMLFRRREEGDGYTKVFRSEERQYKFKLLHSVVTVLLDQRD